MPLRLRLALVVAVFAATLAAGGGLLFARSLDQGQRATLERALEQRARRVGAQLAGHLLPLTPGGSPNPAPDQSLVQVFSSSGRLIYTTQAAGHDPLVAPAEVARARQHALWFQRSRPQWRNSRLLYVLPVPAGTSRVVLVGTSLDQVVDSTAHVQQDLLIGGPIVVLVSAVGAWLLAGRALTPVERLRLQAAQISAGGPPDKLAVPTTRDVLAALAGTLNSLLERLQGALEEQRHFIAAASHELRTPLAALQAELDLATRPGRSEHDTRAALAAISRRVDQLIRLSGRLLVLAQGDQGGLDIIPTIQPLEEIVADSLSAQRAHAEHAQVDLVLDAERVMAPVDATRIQEVLDNLVDNAIRHAPPGTFVEVSVRPDAGWAVLEIRDNGPGISPEFIPRAFEAFSRPDRSRARQQGGAGLGLAIVERIVTAHRGTVALSNHPNGGAVATVRLPAAAQIPVPDPAQGKDRPLPPPGDRGHGPRALAETESPLPTSPTLGARCGTGTPVTSTCWPVHHLREA